MLWAPEAFLSEDRVPPRDLVAESKPIAASCIVPTLRTSRRGGSLCTLAERVGTRRVPNLFPQPSTVINLSRVTNNLDRGNRKVTMELCAVASTAKRQWTE